MKVQTTETIYDSAAHQRDMDHRYGIAIHEGLCPGQFAIVQGDTILDVFGSLSEARNALRFY